MLLMSKFERFVVIICIGSITIVNSLHVLTEYLANPPDRLFTAIAHYWTDYFLYISQMAQGSLLSRHMFTNEPLPPTWIYWFNGLIGALGTRGGLSILAFIRPRASCSDVSPLIRGSAAPAKRFSPLYAGKIWDVVILSSAGIIRASEIFIRMRNTGGCLPPPAAL